MEYEIVPIEELKPLEKVFPNHLENLSKMILNSGKILTPIIADRKTGIVLDGSHRYVFFLKHGFKEVPVTWCNYRNENIRVGTHLMHRHIINESTGISKAEVLERGFRGNVFPPRTTRHFFPFRKDEINLKLSQLKRGESLDFKHLIATVEKQEEIDHNKKYIKEIELEVDEVIKYLEEQRLTKNYLKKQINIMEEEK